jgi:hypothetical protein
MSPLCRDMATKGVTFGFLGGLLGIDPLRKIIRPGPSPSSCRFRPEA